jgi:YHS domain-containing protein
MKSILIIFLLTGLVSGGFAQSEVFTKSGEAIGGYDPVAYFKENKPVKGKTEFGFSWKGADWLFASDQNLEIFKANPEKYAPRYGGFCAYGTADGHKAPTSPDAWTIVDGKLYLNYDKSVQSLWKKDQQGYIQKADKNWPEVKKQAD